MKESQDILQRVIYQRDDIYVTKVVLTETLDIITHQGDYTEEEKDGLARILLAAALFSGVIDHSGELTVQTHALHESPLLVGKCTDKGNMRGLAQEDDEPLSESPSGVPQVVVTYFLKGSHMPAQSVIDLTEPTVESSIADYLVTNGDKSTFVIFYVSATQATAIMVQHRGEELPQTLSDNLRAIFTTGNQANTEKTYADILILLENTLGYAPSVSVSKDLKFSCHCDREKMLAAISLLGEKEALDVFESNHLLDVTCNYCQNEVSFTEGEVRELFVEHRPLH